MRLGRYEMNNLSLAGIAAKYQDERGCDNRTAAQAAFVAAALLAAMVGVEGSEQHFIARAKALERLRDLGVPENTNVRRWVWQQITGGTKNFEFLIWSRAQHVEWTRVTGRELYSDIEHMAFEAWLLDKCNAMQTDS